MTDVLDSIARAHELADSGRPDEGIRLLTAANRTAPDPLVEERLVTLRHEGFAALPHPPPAVIPAKVRAATGTVGPLEPVLPHELTVDTLREGLSRHGCLMVKGLLPPDRTAEMAAGIDRALGAFDDALAGTPAKDTTPWYKQFQPQPGAYRVGGRRQWVRASGGVWTADSPRMLFELIRMIDDTGIGELVAEHLGERPALSANKCTLRRVPVDTNTNWHQDGAFLGEEIRTINLWLSLSHCGTDAPGLDLLPRRLDHVVETGTDGALFDWSVSPNIVNELASTAPVIRPQFEPGDALLFDHLFLHRTAVAPGMTRERHAIETWFFAPSSYPEGQIPILY